MIRLRGFARKTRRLTKGGSLSADPREVGHRPADPAQGSGQEAQMGNNGQNGRNGTNGNHQNGTHDRTGGVNDSIKASDRNGNKMNANGNSVIEELVERRAPIEGRPPFEHN